jgi:hypothetical protein
MSWEYKEGPSYGIVTHLSFTSPIFCFTIDSSIWSDGNCRVAVPDVSHRRIGLLFSPSVLHEKLEHNGSQVRIPLKASCV